MWILDSDQIPPNSQPNSKKLYRFTCDCRIGTQKTMPWKNFACGLSKSCGKCTYILSNELEKTYGLLTPLIPRDNTPISSNSKINFKCACGNHKEIRLKSVLNGLTKSCGCKLNSMSREFQNHARNYLGPKNEIKTNSCNSKPEEWWIEQDFGKLTVIPGQGHIALGSDKMILCQCICGNKHQVRASHLTSNAIQSCGKCSMFSKKWWMSKQWDGSYPNDIESLREFLNGSSLLPLEIQGKKVTTRCLLCNNKFSPSIYDIFQKMIVSCGCTSNKISKQAIKLANELETKFDITVQFEKKIGPWTTDLYLPEHNLAIDIHGLRFHSTAIRDRFKTEQKKFHELSALLDYLVIFEDELINKLSIITSIIASRSNKFKPKNVLRPQSCKLVELSNNEIAPFLDSYHYLGATRSNKLNMALVANDIVIAAICFANPTRQSKHVWELTRMCSHPDFKVHGAWTYIMKHIKLAGSVVSFSDNRLFSGKVYQQMGFALDGKVKPDYWYTNFRVRVHKSKMRKTSEEKALITTEEALRAQQGWYKIFDYGKKRWVTKL